MEYVYVKDSEGYVFKKLASEVAADEKIRNFYKMRKFLFFVEIYPNQYELIKKKR